MEFRTAYDFKRDSLKSSPAGLMEAPKFTLSIDIDGKQVLENDGYTNVYDFIQASYEETQIYNILQRFNNGDVEALNKTVGSFVDVSNMPSSLMEAQNLLIKVNKDFDSLPVDIKAKFDNSVSNYISVLSSGNSEEFISNVYGISKNDLISKVNKHKEDKNNKDKDKDKDKDKE